MDSNSKKVTSIFIVVALAALAALALYVERKQPPPRQQEITSYDLLPGLAEGLQSFARISGLSTDKVRSVRLVRGNGDELAVNRGAPGNQEFYFEAGPPDDIGPFIAMLYGYTAFLNALDIDESYAVTGTPLEYDQLGGLIFTSFDGLVVNFMFQRADGQIWMRVVAARSAKLAERYADTANTSLLTAEQIDDLAKTLNGRLYPTATGENRQGYARRRVNR